MYHWTSEYVGPGHPDKVADQISDGVLDAYLEQDPGARVACETLVKGNRVVLAGEISSSATVDLEHVVRDVIRGIGYDDPALGFSADECEITNWLTKQSPEIGEAVTGGAGGLGAGDQGIMFGYATDETETFMPLTLELARGIGRLVRELPSQPTWKERLGGKLYPDCKSQATVEYADDGRPRRISHLVLSVHHHTDVHLGLLRELFFEHVVPGLGLAELVDDETLHHVNPAGPWTFGGPAADCGLTGRKIVVDNYGADCQIGGGAFSGKDPTKVDRSAAYAARHIAKNIVAAGVAPRCRVQLSYAIGETQPISVRVDTLGTAPPAIERQLDVSVPKLWDLSPGGIIERFQLRRPIYLASARDGHFGHEPGDHAWPWEQLDMVEVFEGLK